MSKHHSAAHSLVGSINYIPDDVEEAKGPNNQSHNNAEPTALPIASPWHPDQFPDGGKDAWLCLLGVRVAPYSLKLHDVPFTSLTLTQSFCCLFVSFGWLNCIGVFQAHYQRNQLRSYSHSNIAWISSLAVSYTHLTLPTKRIV